MSLNIVYVGARGGTCEHRARALASLGHRIRRVVTDAPAGPVVRAISRVLDRIGRSPDFGGANRAMIEAVRDDPPDLVWIDKGRNITPRALRQARAISPRTVILAYSPDDQMNPGNQSIHYLRSIGLYDLHVTTKSYNVQELKDLGAREAIFVDNAYDRETHRPLELDERDLSRYRADVGFIGGFEADRARQMWHLASHGIEVRVWGYAWNRCPLHHPRLRVTNEILTGLEYSKSVNATRINLGFLRKANRDLQTTRTIEIPACGGFLLAERTNEHLRLFREGIEAEFFGSTDELLEKCRYYLENEDERRRIAEAGRRRCIESGYSNEERLATIIAEVERRSLRRAP